MARPDLKLVGEAQQLASRAVQIFHAAARKIAARRAQVGVEDGIATKDIVYKNSCQPILQILLLIE